VRVAALQKRTFARFVISEFSYINSEVGRALVLFYGNFTGGNRIYPQHVVVCLHVIA